MNNYFNYPYPFSDSECNKAEHNPKFCESQNSLSSLNEESKTELVIAERDYKLPSFTEEELQNEVWKTINGFPMYAVSNLGRVFSKYSKKILRPHSSPNSREKGMPCKVILYDFITPPNLTDKSHKYKPFCFAIHSLVKEHFSLTPKSLNYIDEVFVIHKNNNQFDCRVSNLFLTRNHGYNSYVNSIFTQQYNLNNNINSNLSISILENLDKFSGETCTFVYNPKNDIIREFVSKIKSGEYCDFNIEQFDEDYLVLKFKKSSLNQLLQFFIDKGDKQLKKYAETFVCADLWFYK